MTGFGIIDHKLPIKAKTKKYEKFREKNNLKNKLSKNLDSSD